MILPKIFLALTSSDKEELREELKYTLINAGFEITEPDPGIFHSNSLDNNSIELGLNQCVASVHILGGQGGKTVINTDFSIDAYQFKKAKEKQAKDLGLKIFIWNPLASHDQIAPSQAEFISEVQNSVGANMTFTNTPSSLKVAEDIRSILEISEKPELNIPESEIFFISNMLDDEFADEITDMLSDVTKIEKISIEQSLEKDYAELSSQHIQKSKLAVIYFKNSSEWALPFAQQIWKKIGGASSPAPLLLIGDEDPDSNREKVFKAPKVISMIMSGDLIPLEIKVQYDKLTE